MSVAPDQEPDIEPGKEESADRTDDGKDNGFDEADGEKDSRRHQRERQVRVRVRVDARCAELGLPPFTLAPEPAPQRSRPRRPLLQAESKGKDRQGAARGG
jgi:hypothetical protein